MNAFGNVVYMDKQEEGFAQYLSDITWGNELIKDKDYKVASIVVLTEQRKMKTLGEFLGLSGKSFFLIDDNASIPIEQAEKMLKASGKKYLKVAETPIPKGDLALYHVKKKAKIDIDLAVELGLGIITIKGKYIIYTPYASGKEQDIESAVDGVLRMKFYFQLLYPDFIDNSLQEIYFKHTEQFDRLLKVNKDKNLDRLNAIYAKQLQMNV